ncbi:MAG: PKD domain-containing protein [Bacteroidales bacterium]
MKQIFTNLLLLVALCSWAQPVQINRYEYWFNRQVEDKVVSDIAPTDLATLQMNLSAAHLPDGLNSVTLRFRDSQATWSSSLTRFFVKMPVADQGGAQRQITAVAYRFNQQTLVYQDIVPGQDYSFEQSLAAAQLPDGLNSFSIRFRDNTGLWSSMLTRFFVKMPPAGDGNGDPRQIVAYAYRFNQQEMQQHTVSSAADIAIDEILSATQLPDGLNSFSIRFLDNSGFWSSVLTRFFVKLPLADQQGQDNDLVAYQLWFNDDVAGMQQMVIENGSTFLLHESLSAAQLPDGLNRVNVRFRDQRGLWSSLLTRFFVKNPLPPDQQENLMAAWEYWLEDSEGNAFDQFGLPGSTHVVPDEPINPLVLDLNLDLRRIPHGTYQLKFRFLDTRGLWSAVLEREIEKTPFPWALFEASQTVFCGEGTVAFANFSIDADSFLWDFGDGTTSTEPEPQHIYSEAGSYTVSLTAEWSVSGQNHTRVMDDFVIVHPLPQAEVLADGPTSFCEGESVVLTANMEGDYLWSTGATTSSIIADATGDYWVQITDANQCTATSPIVSIEVFPLPQVHILVPENGPWCHGDEVMIFAEPDGEYVWSTGETSEQIIVTETGIYSVTVTDGNGCAGEDETTIEFFPLPEPAFQYQVQGGLVVFENTSQGAYSYLWDFGDGNQSEETNPQHSYSIAGSYEVCLTAYSDMFCQETFCQTLQVSTTTGSLLARDGLKAWPVPFAATLVVVPDPEVLWLLLEVFDAAGQRILRLPLGNPAQQLHLDTSLWSPGVYTLILFSNTGQSARLKTLKK